MAQRFKKTGIVEIPEGLAGVGSVQIDGPEFEVVQGRQANGTAYIGVMYYYKQGAVDQQMFVEYPEPFANLSSAELQVITDLITKGNDKVLAMPQHAGAAPI